MCEAEAVVTSGGDLFAGMWSLLASLGAVPRTLVWDNESSIGQRKGGRPRLTDEVGAFRGVLGMRIHQCRPGDPEVKGLDEPGQWLPGNLVVCRVGRHVSAAVVDEWRSAAGSVVKWGSGLGDGLGAPFGDGDVWLQGWCRLVWLGLGARGAAVGGGGAWFHVKRGWEG